MANQGFTYPLKPASFKDFNGGLNVADNILALKPDESPYILNFQPIQGLNSRLGMSLISLLAAGNNPIQGIGLYKPDNSSNPKVLLAVQNGTLYSVRLSDNTKTTLLAGLSSTKRFDGCKFQGDYWMTNNIDGLIHIYYNSGTLTASLIASAPLGDYLVNDKKGRLELAGNATSPNRVFFCAFENGSDWSTNNNAGFYDIDWDDQIGGMCINGPYLYIGGAKGMKRASVGDIFNMTVDTVPTDQGVMTHFSWINDNNRSYYLSPFNGFFSFDYTVPLSMSKKIADMFIAGTNYLQGSIPVISLNLNKLNLASAVKDGYWYRIALPKAGSTFNNCQLAYYTLTDTWTYYEGQNIACFTLDPDTGIVYGGDSVNGKVYKINDTYTDNGNPIQLDYYSASYDADTPEAQKIASKAKIFTRNSGTEQVTFGYLFDLGNTSSSVTLSLNQATVNWGTTNASTVLQYGTDTTNYQDKWAGNSLSIGNASMHGRGRWINSRFYHAGATTNINVLGYSLFTIPLLPT